MEFAKILLIDAKVAVSPGIGFGEYGEGYVRVALVENEQRIRQAARGVRKVMQNADALLSRHLEEEAAALEPTAAVRKVPDHQIGDPGQS